jgi:hypothetical protein
MAAIHCLMAGNGFGRVTVNIVISSAQNRYILAPVWVPGYVAGITDVVVTINSGVVISSNDANYSAFTVDGAFAPGDRVFIVNNGFIAGARGSGGNGAFWYDSYDGYYGSSTAGTNGGTALYAMRSVSVTNNGTIAGGGGGGGGSAGYEMYPQNSQNEFYTAQYGGYPGDAGAGDGSLTGVNAGTPGGAGGNAGAGGQYGANGQYGTGAPGGAGGPATVGAANITWIATGVRYGAIQ